MNFSNSPRDLPTLCNFRPYVRFTVSTSVSAMDLRWVIGIVSLLLSLLHVNGCSWTKLGAFCLRQTLTLVWDETLIKCKCLTLPYLASSAGAFLTKDKNWVMANKSKGLDMDTRYSYLRFEYIWGSKERAWTETNQPNIVSGWSRSREILSYSKLV